MECSIAIFYKIMFFKGIGKYSSHNVNLKRIEKTILYSPTFLWKLYLYASEMHIIEVTNILAFFFIIIE